MKGVSYTSVTTYSLFLNLLLLLLIPILIIQLCGNRISGSHLLCFIIAYSSSSYRKAGCFGFVFSPLNNLYVRFSKWNLATCVKLPFNHEVKCFYRVCPADMVRCGSAVHIWWLCKESQVVLQSIAQ